MLIVTTNEVLGEWIPAGHRDVFGPTVPTRHALIHTAACGTAVTLSGRCRAPAPAP